MLPEGGTEKLAEFLKGWQPEGYDPRKKLKLD
jgi:hypothetical protein